MNDRTEIQPLIEHIRRTAHRRQEMQDRYFAVPLEHVHQIESTINRMSVEQLHRIRQLIDTDAAREKTRSLFMHGAVKDTALAGSKNPIVRLYKRILFKSLKPLLTHQEEFNRLAAETIQHHQEVLSHYATMISESTLSLGKYSLELIKGVVRASTLMLDDMARDLTEQATQQAADNEQKLASFQDNINTLYSEMLRTRKHIRIGLIHLHHNAQHNTIRSDKRLDELQKNHQHLLELIDDKTAMINTLKRRLRIGLIHLNSSANNNAQRIDFRLNELQNNYQHLLDIIDDKTAPLGTLKRRLRIGLVHLHHTIQRHQDTVNRSLSRTRENSHQALQKANELSLSFTELKKSYDSGERRERKEPAAPGRGEISSDLYNDPLVFDMEKFEKEMRGVDQTQHFKDYIEFFKGKKNVLDLGCGSGEFLQLLKKHDIGGYGVDISKRNVQLCKQKHVKAIESDAVDHISALEAETLDGLFAAQLIEHMEFTEILRLLKLAFIKLQSDAPIILETVNTTCLTIYSGSFYADPTHVRPVHPVTLKYAMQNTGFDDVALRFINPFPESEQLHPVKNVLDSEELPSAVTDVADILDRNSEKLNTILFSYKDYAVIARKP